jgi:hypothetical protein
VKRSEFLSMLALSCVSLATGCVVGSEPGEDELPALSEFPIQASTVPAVVRAPEDCIGTIPGGLKLVALTSPDSLSSPSTYPVLTWCGYTFWALSYDDNRVEMAIVVYDLNRKMVFRFNKAGARYIWKITVNESAQTVTFWGQASHTIVMSWNDLFSVPPVVSAVPLSSAPEAPDGLWPVTDTAGASYPVLRYCGYTYWAFSYDDNREGLAIVAYDIAGRAVKRWDKSGARYIAAIGVDKVGRTVTFTGQAGHKIVMTWQALCVACHLPYKPSAADAMAVAADVNLKLSQADAQALVNALPLFDCTNCQGTGTGGGTGTGDGRLLSSKGRTAGAIVGALIGAAIVCASGGTALVARGAAAVCAAIGANFGLPFDITATGTVYKANDGELATLVYDPIAVGPFSNGAVIEDLFDLNFPRYGTIPEAGAIAPASSGKCKVWYPASKKTTAPDISKYPGRTVSGGSLYKFIFVIVQVANTDAKGRHGRQLRIHPEDYYPDGIPANQRINHSQLSEGRRFVALMTSSTMQVYAAGSLYIINGELRGMDSRTGHYYRSIKGKDAAVLKATRSFLTDLGYNASLILQDEDLDALLNGWF